MLYITGDTHMPTDIGKLNTRNFPDQKQMTKNDYVIICGDFGGVWDGGKEDRFWQKWLDDKLFTTLFVDGNHENFDLLGQCETTELLGGKVRRVSKSVFQLLRGEVYVIEGKTFFAMGGASSHDKAVRKEGRNWWAGELPSDAEYQNARDNLGRHGWAVDYILSHCSPDSIHDRLTSTYPNDGLTFFLEHVVKADCVYEQWFFGHYHVDVDVDPKHICLFQRVLRLL